MRNKIKTTMVAMKVGKGNETLIDKGDKEVSHILEAEQTEETNSKSDEQVVQEPDFMVEPAADPAELLNDLEEMEITFESDDEEMNMNWNQGTTCQRRRQQSVE